jgi:pSer/pThr/pTyr-binding forkhead associated (FHA) protein
MGEERGSVDLGRIRYNLCTVDRVALLAEGELVVGRSPYCSLVLDNEAISRVHASFRVVEDGGVELADLGSSNGTFVNDVRVDAPVRVGRSDEIRLGKVRVWLEPASARAALETGRFASAPETELDDTGGLLPRRRQGP